MSIWLHSEQHCQHKQSSDVFQGLLTNASKCRQLSDSPDLSINETRSSSMNLKWLLAAVLVLQEHIYHCLWFSPVPWAGEPQCQADIAQYSYHKSWWLYLSWVSDWYIFEYYSLAIAVMIFRFKKSRLNAGKTIWTTWPDRPFTDPTVVMFFGAKVQLRTCFICLKTNHVVFHSKKHAPEGTSSTGKKLNAHVERNLSLLCWVSIYELDIIFILIT